MWTPQFAAPGAKTGYGIGFNIGRLDGHRTIGHGGAIYGFATQLLALPDDSIGVVVTATLDGANAVTDHIADVAVRMMLDARAGRPIAAVDSTAPLPNGRALELIGRYTHGATSFELDEFETRAYIASLRGGSRVELRVPPKASAGDLIVDDRLSYGQRVRALDGDRLVVGNDTLRRQLAHTKPPAATAEYASLIGEYGWNHDILYVREKDGKLNALIEWFFEYPLERISRDVYAFPNYGLYDGQRIVFERGADGKATVAIAGTVPFKRRPLPADNDRVNFKITPVKPVAELRREALAASPRRESPNLRQADLVELKSLDSTIKYDIRYATSNNFMGRRSIRRRMRSCSDQPPRRSCEHPPEETRLWVAHSRFLSAWYVTKCSGTARRRTSTCSSPTRLGPRHNRGAAVDLTLYDLKTTPQSLTGAMTK